MRSVVELGPSVPAFLGKLWKLVNDPETNLLISWSQDGRAFVIKNQADFAKELLPLYYKHNNMASFIRQLNMYGFHKITSVDNGGLRFDKDDIEFSHPCFMKGHAYLLEHIKRKIANPKAALTGTNSGEKIIFKPEVMNKVLTDVKQMKGKQENLDAKFSAMKQENEALWREVAILRQKHIKQQQIVNNLIQFLMSLVQPSRPSNSSTNGVGVKRPYQLMINNAAHNTNTDQTYLSRAKHLKLNKESGLIEDLNDDAMEDGPTIHELAHDDNLQTGSEQSPNPSNLVTVQLSPYCNWTTGQSPSDAALQTEYEVTLEDGDELEIDPTTATYIANQNDLLRTGSPRASPKVTSPSPTLLSPPTKIINANANKTPQATSTSKPRTKTANKLTSQLTKNLLSSKNFNIINPSADLKLPAEIFASDDSVSDAGVGTTDEPIAQVLETGQDPMLAVDLSSVSSKDKLLGGVNIKIERLPEDTSVTKKSKSKHKDKVPGLNFMDIKTELQDDLDWNNMTLATVNNNDTNRFLNMSRQDCFNKNYDDFASHFGTNKNKNDIDDHLDTMQTDLESLKELLRSDSYSVDANTLLGLFGSDDPLYGLSYNPVEDRSKGSNNAKTQSGDLSNICDVAGDSQPPGMVDDDSETSNQLISYTGNLPDFDIDIADLEGENSQDACISPQLVEAESTLNTPQIVLQSPAYRKP